MGHVKICDVCEGSFETSWPTKKTCSDNCKRKRLVKLTGRYSDNSLPTATIGTISELVISCDLLKKGYAVFKAMSPACFCDLIAVKNGETFLVEVKTGYKGMNGSISHPDTKYLNEIDIMAIHVRAENQVYYFDKNKSKVDL